jgi:hypothetical protein
MAGRESCVISSMHYSNEFFSFRQRFSLFRHRMHFFATTDFSTLLFSMKMTESGKIVLVSGIIDFKAAQV